MEISTLAGMGKRMPLTSLAFTFGAFSLVGLPPFTGFASKLLIVRAALVKQELIFTVMVVLVLFGTVVEGAYFFRLVQLLYFKGGKNNPDRKEKSPIFALIPISILMILIVFIGVWPKPVIDILSSAASELLNRMDYIKDVLG